MPNVLVRKLTPEDWPLYRTLRLAALEESPDAFGSTFARERVRADEDWAARLAGGASSPRDLPLVVEIDNEPGGLTWVRLDDEETKAAHLYQMWVAPTHRKQGAGRALLNAAIEWARSVGARVLLLDVTAGNSAAAHLYEAAGFAATGNEEPLRPGSPLRSRGMSLSLQPPDAGDKSDTPS